MFINGRVDMGADEYHDCNENGIPDECGGYGDVNHDADVDVDDILCAQDGFANPALCPKAEIFPCGGDGTIDVDDILAILDAFADTRTRTARS